MKINVRFLDNLKVQALFDDFKVISDQPVRYKGDGTAPGPFDYFLASSALCAAYFVKVYCKARDIPTEDIIVTQDNIVNPENRYKQTFNIQVELPESISEKNRQGIIQSIERCTVKKTIQEGPEFKIIAKSILGNDDSLVFDEFLKKDTKTIILGKERPLEDTISHMTSLLKNLGISIEISSWRNPVPGVWSVHVRDADSPMCYTNGKGSTKDSALCSALGEYLERLSSNYFYSDYYLGEDLSSSEFVHYPNEKWFGVPADNSLPKDLMDSYLKDIYDPNAELLASQLIETNSGNSNRGICAIPFVRQSNNKAVFIPVNLIGNLFVSNGMSAGNTKYEARVQCLSEIFERAVKNQIITEEITLPDVPREILKLYPKILAGIEELEKRGFPILVKDASLGGRFPVLNVTLINPQTGGVFASFGAHPKFEVALERSLTELLQGRSFEGLNEMPAPTFNSHAITEHNNVIDHFIDSTGVISWKFFSEKSQFTFKHWDYSDPSTESEFHYLMEILKELKKEVYIADYNDLGTSACRILVPDYSEIYLAEDLLWDNNNQAINFRSKILNLHALNVTDLQQLVSSLEDSELDDFMPVSELIGVGFDENSVWGELVVGELKCLIFLALKEFASALQYVELFFTFNDNSPERKKYFQVLNVLLQIELDPTLVVKDYLPNLIKMYGSHLIANAQKSISGEIRFYGLTPTDSNFAGLDKHLQLIESYKKLLVARRKV